MLRFFRQIRQSLLTQNKFSRYFLYAVGEILLVVIGILLALQIDTWNNGNIDRRKEKEYLSSLIEDLQTQQRLVSAQIQHEARMREKCEIALKQLTSEKIHFDNLTVSLGDITRRTFVVNDPTFQDLKSSGNILLIRDNALRKEILSFYQFLEYSALVIHTSNETSIAVFRDFLLDNLVIDMNQTDSLTVAGGVDFSITTAKVPWAEEVQEEQFRDKKILLKILNRVAARGRTSSVNLDLMNRLEDRIEFMRKAIDTYINE
jgi:hypothetical protein